MKNAPSTKIPVELKDNCYRDILCILSGYLYNRYGPSICSYPMSSVLSTLGVGKNKPTECPSCRWSLLRYTDGTLFLNQFCRSISISLPIQKRWISRTIEAAKKDLKRWNSKTRKRCGNVVGQASRIRNHQLLIPCLQDCHWILAIVNLSSSDNFTSCTICSLDPMLTGQQQDLSSCGPITAENGNPSVSRSTEAAFDGLSTNSST